jgi:hypothetical protein
MLSVALWFAIDLYHKRKERINIPLEYLSDLTRFAAMSSEEYTELGQEEGYHFRHHHISAGRHPTGRPPVVLVHDRTSRSWRGGNRRHEVQRHGDLERGEHIN